MSHLLDKTFVTEDEMSQPHVTVAGWIEDKLLLLKLDTYNEEYIIRITVDRVDNKEI